jgi:pyridoxal phosphate enzyme (YggS family)
VAAVRGEIAAACATAGRDASEVRLVAVSKTVGAAEVAAARAVGVSDFGENRAAQFVEKQAIYPQARWHFIGRIQTNKLKQIVGRAALIHSVASERALQAIGAQAQRLGVVQELLIEINVSGEASKDGVSPTAAGELLKRASELQGVFVRGLMTMAPQGDARAAAATFAGLRELRERLAGGGTASNVCLSVLSMGMSEDFPAAIANGATLVRIGRRIWQ